METVLSTPKRLFPYILQVGESFHIIFDNIPLMQLNCCSSALLHLFCFLYVFNVGYSPEVTPALLFIQHYVLEVVDDISSKCQSLKIFLKQLKQFVSIAT
jgi:hypothetical protein